MQFTTQQICGGQRYSVQSLLGNWVEDASIKEIKQKDYEKKKELGLLKTFVRQDEVAHQLTPHSITKKKDPNDYTVEYGDLVMLANHATEGFLCGNVDEAIPKLQRTCALTTNPGMNAPCHRNVFRIERALDAHRNRDGDGYGDSNKVHYGQNFRLRLEVGTSGRKRKTDDDTEPLYLCSEPLTALSASKVSRKQEIMLSATTSKSMSLWTMLTADTKGRFKTDFKEIDTRDSLVIKHGQTGSFLSSAIIHHPSFHFAQEHEVHGHLYYSTNKAHHLCAEKTGEITGEYVLRRHGAENKWTICYDRPEGPSATLKEAVEEEAKAEVNLNDTAATELKTNE